MSAPTDELKEVSDALFSEGVRSDGNPKRPTESAFAFDDRIRQPYFERQRRWFEEAFSRYPAGEDRGDVRSRFRSTNDVQHGAAEWELYQHELWHRLGWKLTPHPVTPGPRRRDFLVERGPDTFILECAVDNPSLKQAGEERRWRDLRSGLKSLSSPCHGLRFHRRSIGERSLSARPLLSAAQRHLDSIPAGQGGVVLRVDTDGWRFHIEALPHVPSKFVSEVEAAAGRSEKRLYEPIRNRVRDKTSYSSSLGQPFVLALLVVTDLPIVSKAGAVREALLGLPSPAPPDGTWVRSGESRGRGLSGVLLQEGTVFGCGLPVVHHHPDPLHPFSIPDLPFAQVRYDLSDVTAEAEEPARTSWHNFFRLPPEWPGPEDPYEGISTGAPIPPPQRWSPPLRTRRRRSRGRRCSDLLPFAA